MGEFLAAPTLKPHVSDALAGLGEHTRQFVANALFDFSFEQHRRDRNNAVHLNLLIADDQLAANAKAKSGKAELPAVTFPLLIELAEFVFMLRLEFLYIPLKALHRFVASKRVFLRDGKTWHPGFRFLPTAVVSSALKLH